MHNTALSVLHPTVHKTTHTKIKKKKQFFLLWSAIDRNNNKYTKRIKSLALTGKIKERQ